MPLTPGNNWTATVMFCGGSNIATAEYVSPLYSLLLNMEILTCVFICSWTRNWDIPHFGASQSCVSITPDVSGTYTKMDNLPEGRTMGNLIQLPNGQILCLNGASQGT